MRFLKMTTINEKPVLINPDHIVSVGITDLGDNGFSLTVGLTGRDTPTQCWPVDEGGELLTKAAVAKDIASYWGKAVLLDRFESYIDSRS